MNRILEIDETEHTALVEPGVLNADLRSRAARSGLLYAPDPASAAICSIGGNIATNAGGMCCAKYGVTRESVLQLTAVLADGDIVTTGHRTIKGVAGYDLTSLLVGSEGTLAVVVQALLRLRPLQKDRTTLLAGFATVGEAAAACTDMISHGAQPLMLELMDKLALNAIDAMHGTTQFPAHDAVVLAQYEGAGAVADAELATAILLRHGAAVETATGWDEQEHLVQLRRDAIPALEQYGVVSIGDIGVPRRHLAATVADIAQLSKSSGIRISALAHASDGNLHPCLVLQPGQRVDTGAPKEVLGGLFAIAQRYGGTLTGEHGIGLLKRPWMHAEVGDVQLQLMQAVKKVFDPQGILNPGKGLGLGEHKQAIPEAPHGK